jgi:hypothetical protein
VLPPLAVELLDRHVRGDAGLSRRRAGRLEDAIVELEDERRGNGHLDPQVARGAEREADRAFLRLAGDLDLVLRDEGLQVVRLADQRVENRRIGSARLRSVLEQGEGEGGDHDLAQSSP